MQLVDFVAEFDGGGLVRVGEESMVAVAVDEGFLEGEEVSGEEDVGAEGGEKGVEVGRGGGGKGG